MPWKAREHGMASGLVSNNRMNYRTPWLLKKLFGLPLITRKQDPQGGRRIMQQKQRKPKLSGFHQPRSSSEVKESVTRPAVGLAITALCSPSAVETMQRMHQPWGSFRLEVPRLLHRPRVRLGPCSRGEVESRPICGVVRPAVVMPPRLQPRTVKEDYGICKEKRKQRSSKLRRISDVFFFAFRKLNRATSLVSASNGREQN